MNIVIIDTKHKKNNDLIGQVALVLDYIKDKKGDDCIKALCGDAEIRLFKVEHTEELDDENILMLA